ncbi:uncharacterized protein LOC111065280 [Drosophila obscura]|uniref:uncharacterized protein LOC111065280 n=1 Tax=Drosophila obscura TaxID=7282 RepID=UPI001BB2845D|nr:uncharacterized protein LOC111065280 [Drosophila obscura]
MEHHTYAKSGLKIWTIEQKRSLVKKRINADYLFNKPSLRGDRPWKTFKEMAQIGDFSEHALRQQWQALVFDYRTEKEGITSPINDLVVKSLNEKWEFFGEIHRFMIKKNDHHSYAQKEPNPNVRAAHVTATSPPYSPILRCPDAAKVVAKAQSTAENNAENSSDDDGLEIIAPEAYPTNASKKLLEVDPRTSKKMHPKEQNDKEKVDGVKEVCISPNKIKTEKNDEVNEDDIPNPPYVWPEQSGPSENNQNENDNNSAQPKARKSRKRRGSGKVLSEKDKYYKHRRRLDHRMEKRLNGLGLAVSVILKHFASNLKAQCEMPDLGKLFDPDSEPSSSSGSSTDEDSD